MTAPRSGPIALPGAPVRRLRDRVFAFMRKLDDAGAIHPMGDAETFKPDSVIVVTLAATFDPMSNLIWSDKRNWSQPRDLHCRDCAGQVVMSDAMHELYQTRGGRPDMIVCLACLGRRAAKGGGP